MEAADGETPAATQPSEGLQVNNIRNSFKKITALEHVSFSINKSEVFALLGPNGAGKSTMISLVRGDTGPSGREGDILWEE